MFVLRILLVLDVGVCTAHTPLTAVFRPSTGIPIRAAIFDLQSEILSTRHTLENLWNGAQSTDSLSVLILGSIPRVFEVFGTANTRPKY